MLLASATLAFVIPAVSAEAQPSFPTFALENWDGRLLTNAVFEGKTTIVVPTYAKCIFACPMITSLLTKLDQELGAPADLQYLHVSVNPADDTAEEILAHFEKHEIDAKSDPRWLFVNGPEEEIQKLLAETEIEVKRREVEEGILTVHTVRVFVVGPEGRTLKRFDTYYWDKKEMRDALRH